MGVLPASVEADLKTAFAPSATPDEVDVAIGRAFEKVTWDAGSRMVPRAEDLTAAQRELLLRFGDRNVNLFRFYVPASGAIRQRWLGVTPGGVLERKGTFTIAGRKRTETLWRAVVEVAAEGDPATLEEILGTLSLEDRLRAFGEVNAAIGWGSAYGIGEKVFFDFWDTKLLARLGSEGKSWAPVFADALLAQALSRQPGESHWTLTSSRCWPVFLALVRAKIPIEPRWDVLLPIGGQDAFEACVECARAIPESRRAAALVAAVTRENDPVAVGLPLLGVFPSVELAKRIKASTGGAGLPKKKILAELDRLAEAHPLIRDALAAKPSKPSKPAKPSKPSKTSAAKEIALTCTEVLRPRSFDELSPSHRQQLPIAGRRSDGRDVTVEARFAEEGFGPGFLEICKLCEPSGRHRYDALLFRGDSGIVFEARAKRVVAEIIQDGVECKSAALRDALEAALAERPRA